MALTAEQEAAVLKLVSDPAGVLLGDEKVKKGLGDLVTTAVGQATTTLSKSVEEITTTVKKLGEAKPDSKGDDKGKGKDDGEPPAWAKSLIDSTKKAEERFAAMDAEKAKATEASARKALIEKVLTGEKYSGLLKHSTFVRSLELAGVKTEDEVKAGLKTYIDEQKALGVEIKPTAASPEGEGAKKPTSEQGRQAFTTIAKEILDRDRKNAGAAG